RGAVRRTNLRMPQAGEGSLAPLALDLRDFTTIPDHAGLYHLAAMDPGRGGWEWRGGLTTEPAHAEGTLEIRGSQLRPRWVIAKNRLGVEILDGRFGCRLSYVVDVKGDSVLARLHDTSLSVAGLALREKGKDPELFRCDTLSVRGVEVRYPE